MNIITTDIDITVNVPPITPVEIVIPTNQPARVTLATPGPRGLPGEDADFTLFETILPDTLEVVIEPVTHQIENVRMARLFEPAGNEVSFVYKINNNIITLYSNVSLLDHKLKLF